MLIDVVVDTNVWAHAANPNDAHFAVAKAFCDAILASDTALVVDVRGAIRTEYRETVRQGYGAETVAFLARTLRVAEVADSVEPAERSLIRSLVPRNATDRTFVKTALNSAAKVLVSHDDDDFPESVRQELWAQLDVRTIDALSASGEL